MIGYDQHGTGDLAVVVLNDWLDDTSTWVGARPYLDAARFTWIFADLRGYGRSRGQAGRFDVKEAAGDVLALADHLGFARFAVVGHSMSSLPTLHLAQHHADRIVRAAVIAPPGIAGQGADADQLAAVERMARADDEVRMSAMRSMWGDRLGEAWIAFKAARWRAAADPEAAAAYAAMFARDGLPDPAARVGVPLLAVTGGQDAPPMRRAPVAAMLAPLAEQLKVVAIADSGHYPMQEAPPLTAAIVQRFLGAGGA